MSGLGTITVDVSVGADVDEIESAVCEEIRRFVEEGPDAAELESVIADTERSWLSALASIEERADHISHHALLTGDPAYVNTFVDRIRSVTAEQARSRRGDVARPRGPGRRRYLSRRARPDVRRTDKAGGGLMTAVARPVVAPPEPWEFPEGSTYDLPNGLRLLTYDVPGQYVVSVRLGLPVSLRDEPREREGVASIMARTLDEGTQSHTAEEFARLLERKGVSFGAGMADAGLSIDLDVVKGNLEPALDLLRQILTEPAFPQTEVARQVRTRIAEIEQERSIAAHRAGLEFVRTFYAPDDRSSRPTGGTPRDGVVHHPRGRRGLPCRARRRCRRDRRRRRRPRGPRRAGARRVGSRPLGEGPSPS